MNTDARAVDVLIIGLGPAGAATAVTAAAAGLEVLGIDKRQIIGKPVQCAEFIPLPMGRYAQAPGVLLQTIQGMRSILPSGASLNTAFPGLMVDRATFDQALVDQARSQGAQLRTLQRLVGLDTVQRIAHIATPDGEELIQYQVLVAADGPHSTVAHLLGWPELESVFTRQYTVGLKKPYHDTDIWLSNDYPGGYAWLFPKGCRANLGLGLDKHHAADLKQPLDALHQQLIETGLVDDCIYERTGGAIPVGGLREHLFVDTIMFTGDAAGLTHPITGAGIPAAVISGERAGQAAIDSLIAHKKDAFSDFEEDLRDQFEVALQRAVVRRSWMAKYWNTSEASDDLLHRRGWIAFPDYFETQQTPL